MRIINNRYKILFLSYTEPLYDEYLVEDILTQKEMSLYIFKIKVFNDAFANFIKKNFLKITKLNNFFLEKSYEFKRIRAVDNELASDVLFLLCEKFEVETNFFNYLKTCEFDQKIDLFVAICRAVFFLHANKLFYSGIQIDYILLFNDKGKINAKLKNLVMRKFDLYYKVGASYKNLDTDTAITFESEKQKDIFSLGLILLTILKGVEVNAISEREIKNFSPEGLKNKTQLNQLKNLILKLISLKFDSTFGANDIILELSNIFQRPFYVIQNKTNNLLFPSFNSHTLEMQLIISSSFKRDNWVKAENLFLVRGEKGVGKTRFLQELQTRLHFEKILTFSLYNTDKTELSDICTQFLEKTNLFTLTSQKENKFIEFNNIDDIHNKDWAKEYFDFFEQARKNIQNISSKTPVVIIIDNVNLIKEREFLKGLLVLTNEIRSLNFVMVLSYDESDTNFHNFLVEEISQIQKINFFKMLSLKNLSQAKIKTLIDDLLYFKDLPAKFAESFFLQSNGNPQKLINLLNLAFENKQIFINKKTGFAELSKSFAEETKNKEIATHIIVQNLNERLAFFSESDIEMLKFIAIFNGLVNETWIFENKTSVEKERLSKVLQQFKLSKIISHRLIDGYKKYYISDYVLKDLILKNLSKEEIIKLHKKAASQMMPCVVETSDMEELAYQLKCSNQLSLARRYYIKLGIHNKKIKNIFGVIDNLLSAIDCTKKTEKLFLAKLYLDLGTFVFETGKLSRSEKYLKKALRLCKNLDNEKLLAEVYIQLVFLFDLNFEEEKLASCLELAKKIILLKPEKYYRSYAGVLRIQALLSYDKIEYDKAIILCEKIFEIADNIPAALKEKSNALRLVAKIYFLRKDFDKAEKALEESVRIANKLGHIRGVLYGYINFAFLYNSKNEKQKALEYYRKTQTESVKYKMINSELLANDYIAGYYFDTKQYQLSYKYALHSFELAKKNKIRESIMSFSFLLLHNALKLDNSKIAKYYFNTVKNFINYDELNIYNYDFHNAVAQYNYYFRDFETAKENLEKLKLYQKLKSGFEVIYTDFCLSLLAFEINPSAENSKRILQLILENKDTESLTEYCYNAFLAFMRQNNIDGMRDIYTYLVNIDENEISIDERCKIYFMSSFFETKKAKEYLLNILRQAFTLNLRLLKTYTLIALADHCIKEKNFNIALALFIEATVSIKQFLTKLPKEKWFTFFTGEKFYIVTENIKLLMNKKTSVFFSYLSENKFKPTPRYFENFKKKDYRKLISSKNNFYNEIAPFFLGIKSPVNADTNILDKLNTEIKNDINTFLKKLVCQTLSTEAFVVVVKNKKDVDVISHFSYLKKEPNLNLFYKITSSDKHIVLDKTQLETMNLKTDIQACMMFPIRRNYLEADHDHDVLAYVYLESIYGINLIAKDGLAILQTYKNLLGLLLRSFTLFQNSTIDKLTKALSRDALNARLEDYSNRYSIFSLLYYDLDSFKQINDNYGHDVGDVVLATISNVASSMLDEPEFLGRQGGEEFIVCLPNTNATAAFERAEEIRKAVEKTNFLGYTFKMTISLGVATYGNHSHTISDIIHMADHAMYFSKQSGKNRTTVWNENLKQNRISVDGLSQISGMNNFWKIDTTNFIIEILKLSNSNESDLNIIETYIECAGTFIKAENALLVFTKDEKILNESYLKKKLGRKPPFWFSNVIDFVKAKEKGVKILTDFPANETKAIFRNGVSILLLPITFKGQFLGATCFTTQHNIKAFNFEDASIQSFATNIIAHSCYEVYKTLL